MGAAVTRATAYGRPRLVTVGGMFPPRTLGRFGLPVVLGVAAALVAVPAPAQADVTGTTSTTDVVLYRPLPAPRHRLRPAVSPGTAFWRLEVQVFGPEGNTSEGTVANSATSPTKGTVTVPFCGSETPGTYTVRGTGFYEVAARPSRSPTRCPRPRSRCAGPRPAPRCPGRRSTTGSRARRSRSTEQGPNGWAPSNGVLVRLEKLARRAVAQGARDHAHHGPRHREGHDPSRPGHAAPGRRP